MRWIRTRSSKSHQALVSSAKSFISILELVALVYTTSWMSRACEIARLPTERFQILWGGMGLGLRKPGGAVELGRGVNTFQIRAVLIVDLGKFIS